MVISLLDQNERMLIEMFKDDLLIAAVAGDLLHPRIIFSQQAEIGAGS